MAWAALNGSPVLEARVDIPRVGAWTADVVLDAADAPTGRVQLDLNGVGLSGTARRSGLVADTALVRVVGGAGGLPTLLDALAYRNVPLRSPLEDVLAGAGEALASDSDAGLLANTLPLWLRRAGSAAEALMQLLREAPGATWRVNASGKVWLGQETWPDSGLADFELLREDPLNFRVQLYADTPSVMPGTLFQGQRVSYVEHTVTEDQLRTVLWFES